MELKTLMNNMLDTNIFFSDIKRLLTNKNLKEYGIDMLKATIKFEIIEKSTKKIRSIFHLFDDNGNTLVSILITDECTVIPDLIKDEHRKKIKDYLKTKNKNWKTLEDVGIDLRYTPYGAAVTHFFEYGADLTTIAEKTEQIETNIQALLKYGDLSPKVYNEVVKIGAYAREVQKYIEAIEININNETSTIYYYENDLNNLILTGVNAGTYNLTFGGTGTYTVTNYSNGSTTTINNYSVYSFFDNLISGVYSFVSMNQTYTCTFFDYKNFTINTIIFTADCIQSVSE